MIGLIGINYKTASIGIREKFSFSSTEIVEFIKLLRQDSNVIGTVIISTCNRTEIYFHIESCCDKSALQLVLQNLNEFKSDTPDNRKCFYFKTGKQVTEHLFKVTSGLDSLILGEDQVIGQVKEAFKISNKHNFAGRLLTRMFHKALEIGKRVRTETSISKGTASVSSAAVEMCNRHSSDFSSQSVLMVGTGQTGELVVQNLFKKGSKKIYVTNRTYSKAETIASKYNAIPLEFSKLDEYIGSCDIILVATSAKSQLLQRKW